VTYSAHVSDYFFSNGVDSVINRIGIVKKWNSYDKHVMGERADFPGITITVIFILSLFYILIRKKRAIIGVKIEGGDLFFLLLIVFGLLFSLGPRLNFNGVYAGIPTPYTFLIKYIPFFDSIRGLARWSFLFYFGLAYFFAKYLSNKKLWLVLMVFGLALLECLPINYLTTKEEYLDYTTDIILKNECQGDKGKVLLEIPTSHLSVGKGIYVGLNYISKRQLASVYHGCLLVNGYSGYEPPSQTSYFQSVESSLKNLDPDDFINELRSRGVSYLRISPEFLVESERQNYLTTIEILLKDKSLIKLSDFLYKVTD
jgi:hypothetical protein